MNQYSYSDFGFDSFLRRRMLAPANKSSALTVQNTFAYGSITSDKLSTDTYTVEQLTVTDIATIDTLYLNDTNDSDYLQIIYNDNDTAQRILALKMGGGDRTLYMDANIQASTLAILTNPTFSGITMADATNIVLNTSTGTKIGTATGQKLGFYNKTPVDQPATVSDPSGGATQDAEARTAIAAIIDRLQELGLIA